MSTEPYSMSVHRLLCKPRTWALYLVVCLLLDTCQGHDYRVDQLRTIMDIFKSILGIKIHLPIIYFDSAKNCPKDEIIDDLLANSDSHPIDVVYTACFCGTDKFYWKIQKFTNYRDAMGEAFSNTEFCHDAVEMYRSNGSIWIHRPSDSRN